MCTVRDSLWTSFCLSAGRRYQTEITHNWILTSKNMCSLSMESNLSRPFLGLGRRLWWPRPLPFCSRYWIVDNRHFSRQIRLEMPTRLCSLSNGHVKQFIFLRFLELPCFWSSAVQCRDYNVCFWCCHFHAAFVCVNETRISVSHLLKLGKRVQNVLAIPGVLGTNGDVVSQVCI